MSDLDDRQRLFQLMVFVFDDNYSLKHQLIFGTGENWTSSFLFNYQILY